MSGINRFMTATQARTLTEIYRANNMPQEITDAVHLNSAALNLNHVAFEKMNADEVGLLSFIVDTDQDKLLRALAMVKNPAAGNNRIARMIGIDTLNESVATDVPTTFDPMTMTIIDWSPLAENMLALVAGATMTNSTLDMTAAYRYLNSNIVDSLIGESEIDDLNDTLDGDSNPDTLTVGKDFFFVVNPDLDNEEHLLAKVRSWHILSTDLDRLDAVIGDYGSTYDFAQYVLGTDPDHLELPEEIALVTADHISSYAYPTISEYASRHNVEPTSVTRL